MSTIMCLDCSHIVLVYHWKYEQSEDDMRRGRISNPVLKGRCSHCGAEYEVEVRKVKETELQGPELEDRINKHRG